MAFEYQELTAGERLAQVKTRIRELENQHLQVKLRVEAPDVNAPANEADKQALAHLEESLGRLHQLSDSLSKDK